MSNRSRLRWTQRGRRTRRQGKGARRGSPRSATLFSARTSRSRRFAWTIGRDDGVGIHQDSGGQDDDWPWSQTMVFVLHWPAWFHLACIMRLHHVSDVLHRGRHNDSNGWFRSCFSTFPSFVTMLPSLLRHDPSSIQLGLLWLIGGV